MRSIARLAALLPFLPAVAAAQDPPKSATAPPPARTRTVAVVVHEGVELLDFAGPGETFEAAGANDGGPRWFQVVTVAPSAGPIVSQRFVTVTPKHTIADCPKADILVIPGGATNVLLRDEAFLAWAKKAAAEAEITLTVCTGAFVAAKTGLLDGGEATTHWSAIAGLRRDASKTKVLENVRFVDNGRVVTTAGVSAGIDGALHVVARLLGRAHAEKTARYMEYLWTPVPEHAKRYAAGNPHLDARAQAKAAAEAHIAAERWKEAVATLKPLTESDAKDGAAWARLGVAYLGGGAFDDAIAAETKAAEFPEQRPKAFYNLACAHARKGEKEKALESLKKAVDAGWANRKWTEADEDLASLRGEARFVEILDGMKPAPPRG